MSINFPIRYRLKFDDNTCCCNILNSLGFVLVGTNCKALSILTAVECVGEPSATHYTTLISRSQMILLI